MTLLLLALACSSADLDSAAPDARDTGQVMDMDELCAEPADGPAGAVVGTIDCTDGVCEVPAGDFWRGEASPDFPNRCPLEQVTLSAFAIDETEVTRGHWHECVDAGVCDEIPPHCVSEAPTMDEELQPAICISWDMARGYCEWRGGRLPTEAEWEKAARGTDAAIWAWGAAPPSCNTANYRFPPTFCEVGVVDVKSYPGRSAYGLYDTVGNAWEWVSDWYDARYYHDGPTTDPQGPDDDRCAEAVDDDRGECRFKVMRGGAYNTTENNTRGGSRASGVYGIFDTNTGFRCAYDR